MKVITACLNSKYVHACSAPWCLAAGVREFAKGDIDCEVFESTVNSDIDLLCERLTAAKPDVLSFCCYIWNITKTLEICERIKRDAGCIIVLGGPEVAYRPKDVLCRYGFIDYVLSGEGEFCFPEFLDMLYFGSQKSSVPGLSFRQENEIISVPEKAYTATPPSPFGEQYLNALNGRICYIESSRGCPYRCAFCLSGRVSRLRFFDMEVTKADILKLAKSGTQTVKFVDRTFNSSERHANEILTFIKDNYNKEIPSSVCFHFEIAGDILKESTFEILSQMPKGAVQLEIGMQSFNEQTLLAVGRKTDTARLTENIKRLVSFKNMHIHIDLIAGLTGEDMQSFEHSFNTGFALEANMLQLGFLKLLYGADMRENEDRYPCTYSNEPPYEVISTPWLSEEDILTLKGCEDALDRLYNSGRFLMSLEYILNKTGLSPFRLFCNFGNAVRGDGMSLTHYAVKVFDYFKDFCDGKELCEKLVCDLLCSGSQIPNELKIMDRRHKKAKALLCRGGDIKVAVLPESRKIFAADRGGQRDLFGRYPYKIYDINILD